MKKPQLRQLIRECLKEVLDTDDAESSKAFGDIHKDNEIKGQSEFVKAYIRAALWSSSSDNGDELEKKYTVDDIDHDTLVRMAKDSKDFQDKYGELYDQGGWDDEQAAIDFWLSRNGHGSGFKDRGYDYNNEEIGDKLHKAAESYGPYDLYLGDGQYDGILFGYPPG